VHFIEGKQMAVKYGRNSDAAEIAVVLGVVGALMMGCFFLGVLY
jgi:hypothetical protein